MWKWGTSVGGNLWRTTGDISDKYVRMAEIGFSQAGLSKFAGPGHWNDPDMLEVGNGGMTTDEYRTHMSLWALLAAPLLAGNDMTQASPETLSILTNREIIAIDQDPAGIQGDRVGAEGPAEIWMRPLSDGSKAVALFNRHHSPLEIALDFQQVGFKGKIRVRDIWSARDLGTLTKEYRTMVPRHGVVLLKILPAK